MLKANPTDLHDSYRERHLDFTTTWPEYHGFDVPLEQSDVIDIISTDRTTGDVTLTISDHLDWTGSAGHQVLLQSKVNRFTKLPYGQGQTDHFQCGIQARARRRWSSILGEGAPDH